MVERERLLMEFFISKKKRKRKFWFEDNQDAQGYEYGDNRVIRTPQAPQDRREVIRREWNF